MESKNIWTTHGSAYTRELFCILVVFVTQNCHQKIPSVAICVDLFLQSSVYKFFFKIRGVVKLLIYIISINFGKEEQHLQPIYTIHWIIACIKVNGKSLFSLVKPLISHFSFNEASHRPHVASFNVRLPSYSLP